MFIIFSRQSQSTKIWAFNTIAQLIDVNGEDPNPG